MMIVRPVRTTDLPVLEQMAAASAASAAGVTGLTPQREYLFCHKTISHDQYWEIAWLKFPKHFDATDKSAQAAFVSCIRPKFYYAK